MGCPIPYQHLFTNFHWSYALAMTGKKKGFEPLNWGGQPARSAQFFDMFSICLICQVLTGIFSVRKTEMIRQKNLWLRDITILLGLDFEFESVAQVFGLTRNWKNTYLNWSHWARVQTMLILWLDWGKRASMFIFLVVDSWQSIYREVYLRLLEFTNRIVGKLMSLIFESLYLDCFSKLAKGERLASMCLRNNSIVKLCFIKTF